MKPSEEAEKKRKAEAIRSYQAQRTEEAKTQQREDAHRISYQENTDPNEYY